MTVAAPVRIAAVPAEPPAPGRNLRASGLLVALAGLLALNVAVLVPALSPVRAVVTAPVVLVLPGALVLTLIGGRWGGWPALLQAVPLSLLVLMGLGLVAALLPGPGLTTGAALVAVDLAMLVLIVACALRRRPAAAVPRRWRLPRYGLARATAAIIAGAAAVALTVAGADRLNGGGSADLTAAGLGCAVLALAVAVTAARARRTGAAATAVYLAGLAVLLATSLRGTVVSGHDIKVEYRVFLDTLTSGSWHPGGPYAGYNSCLSLTVLPAMLARLLGIAALDVFRVVFQLVFALVPVGAFLLARRMLRPTLAAVSAVLVVAFPTFVNDMPMLNRQEIGLLFFTAGLITALDRRAPGPRRGVLLLTAAAGLTVSHYSSAGVCAAMLVLAWLCYRVRRLLPFPATPAPVRPRPGTAAAVMAGLVLAWSAVTGTAATFGDDLAGTARAVLTGAPVASGATAYAPHDSSRAGDAEVLRSYLTDLVAQRRAAGSRLGPPAAVPPAVLPADELPVTAAGHLVRDAGLPPATLNGLARKAAVVLFEAFAVLGCLLLWARLRRTSRVPRPARTLVAEWSLAAVLLLALTVVAPQIADSYGVLRLYQQLLPVLGVCVVAVPAAVVSWLRRPRWTGAIVTVVALATLVTTSGLLPRATGGYPPQLNLANAGPYYRAYLAGPDDVALAEAVAAAVPAEAGIVADSRDSLDLRALAGRQPAEGVGPGAIPDDAYLVVTRFRADQAVAVAVVGDRVIRYVFPLAAVTTGRRLIAVTGDHLLYAPL